MPHHAPAHKHPAPSDATIGPCCADAQLQDHIVGCLGHVHRTAGIKVGVTRKPAWLHCSSEHRFQCTPNTAAGGHQMLPSASNMGSICTSLSRTSVKGGLQHQHQHRQTGAEVSVPSRQSCSSAPHTGRITPVYRHDTTAGAALPCRAVAAWCVCVCAASPCAKSVRMYLSEGSFDMQAASRSRSSGGMSDGSCSRRPMPMACSTWL